MNAIPELGSLLDTPLAQALGWALLQFVWQGAVVGVVAAAALGALRRSGPDVRYVVATISMSLMLTLPVVSVVQELNAANQGQTPAARATTGEDPRGHSIGSTVAPVDRERRSAERSENSILPLPGVRTAVPSVQPYRLASWLLVAWMAGVFLLTARLVSGWFRVQRLRMHGKPAASPLCATAERLARRLRVTRAVRIVESAAVGVPTVMGWLKPVVLLPASALAGLSPTQLEAVLAHELAHVRRHDYLVNLLQTVVETLLFYHPAVWWVSRQIRIERENCCDDLAVSLCGDRVFYAQALADLEQLRGSAGPLAMAANGGSLVQRVRRLLGGPSYTTATPGWLAIAIAMAVLVSIAGVAARAMDRNTAKPVAKTAAAAHQGESSGRSGLQERRRHVEEIRLEPQDFQRAAPNAFDRLLQETTREFSLALRRSHRALTAALRDAFPQVPPLPPLPPGPAEAPLPPATPELPEPVQLPAPAAPVDVPLPPQPPSLSDVPPPLPEAPPPPQAVPLPPVPPAVRSQRSGNFMWSNDGEKLEVNYRGEIEFTDDDSDVKSPTPDGWLRIKESGRNGAHAIEFRADAPGQIGRKFWIGTAERPFEPEGRKWLSQILPRFIRQSGIGAEARARRIYKAKGAQGVLGEISVIEGSWAKRIYFTELLKTPGLDPRAVHQAFDQAGREVESDFELASLLISSDHLLTGDATRKAFIEAARSIDSDFEMRRVYSSALKRGTLTPVVLAALLESSTAIGSDFEQASLLIDVAKMQSLSDATRTPFLKAVATIDSDFEQRRVLSSVVARGDLSPAILGAALDSAAGIGSDFEVATLLLEVVKSRSIEGELRGPFFRAVDSIGSDFERGRVLQAAATRRDASDQTIMKILPSPSSLLPSPTPASASAGATSWRARTPAPLAARLLRRTAVQ